MKDGIYICERIEENIALFEATGGEEGFAALADDFPFRLCEGEFYMFEFSENGEILSAQMAEGKKSYAICENRKKLDNLFDN